MNKTFLIDYITIMQPKYIDVFLISRSRISEKDLSIVAFVCASVWPEIKRFITCPSVILDADWSTGVTPGAVHI